MMLLGGRSSLGACGGMRVAWRELPLPSCPHPLVPMAQHRLSLSIPSVSSASVPRPRCCFFHSTPTQAACKGTDGLSFEGKACPKTFLKHPSVKGGLDCTYTCLQLLLHNAVKREGAMHNVLMFACVTCSVGAICYTSKPTLWESLWKLMQLVCS